ncbi:MAG: acetylglutamate kinase [Clostridiaceae bacterium]
MTFRDIEKAGVLIQALPYIQKFSGETIVVKYGGNAMINEGLKDAVIRDLILLSLVGIKIVVVHGGGPDISANLKKLGKKSEFINGLRVTDDETMEIVQMVLAGKVNKDLTALIIKNGGNAIGLSGLDGGLLRAKKKFLEDGTDVGYVGDITSVNEEILVRNMEGGLIPIVSTVALGEDDFKSYNINADYAASKIAAKLNAKKLILLTDVPGILNDPIDSASLIRRANKEEIDKLKEEGIIKGGMIPKVECCQDAIENGVKKAHIIDGRVPHSILLELFSDKGIGTMITK